jgi:hypothetical protein
MSEETVVDRGLPIAGIPDLHHSAEFKNIYAAFIQAQAEFTAIPKKKTATIRNQKTGSVYTYKYADLADVLAMALPVLTRHELGLMQPHIRVDGRLRVCTRLIHATGEWLMSDGVAVLESGSPQEFGTDSTYYRRYDVCTFLGIVADEDIDAQKDAEIRQSAPQVRQPRAVPRPIGVTAPQPKTELFPERPVPADKTNPQASADADDELAVREDLIHKLKNMVPDNKELGKRAAAMFPQHRSTKTLTVADLQRLYETLQNEKEYVESLTEIVDQSPIVTPTPPAHEETADIATMFAEGKLTTASRLTGPTIGKGLAQRLHKLIAIHKIHTEEELLEDYLKPMGLEHASDLPRDLYDSLCDWAEGKLQEGTSNGENGE